LQIHTFSLQLGLDEIQNLGMWHRRGRHFQHYIRRMGRHGQGRNSKNGKRFFEHGVLTNEKDQPRQLLGFLLMGLNQDGASLALFGISLKENKEIWL
jgi:hypothetical protein